MSEKLFVAVLGNRDSGKSTTWNYLFRKRVKTGSNPRSLELRPGKCVNVFLVSGSFEERGLYAGDVLDNQNSKVVLCSIQYTKEVNKTFEYVKEKGFDIYIHWLNPGFNDKGENWDRLGLINQILDAPSVLAIRSGKDDPSNRVQEIREFIYGWALYRDLIFKC